MYDHHNTLQRTARELPDSSADAERRATQLTCSGEAHGWVCGAGTTALGKHDFRHAESWRRRNWQGPEEPQKDRDMLKICSLPPMAPTGAPSQRPPWRCPCSPARGCALAPPAAAPSASTWRTSPSPETTAVTVHRRGDTSGKAGRCILDDLLPPQRLRLQIRPLGHAPDIACVTDEPTLSFVTVGCASAKNDDSGW